jgi:hypothetical protein
MVTETGHARYALNGLGRCPFLGDSRYPSRNSQPSIQYAEGDAFQGHGSRPFQELLCGLGDKHVVWIAFVGSFDVHAFTRGGIDVIHLELLDLKSQCASTLFACGSQI